MKNTEMHKYCTLTKRISRVRDASKDQKAAIKKQMQICKSTLFEHLSGNDIEKMLVPASANFPELVLQMCFRKTQQKIDSTITCDAWKEIYNWSTLQPLLSEGKTLEDATCAALRDKVEELITKKTPYADVVLKGSKGELQTDETQTGPTPTVPKDIDKTCILLWKLKCDMKELDKADKEALGDMKKQLKELEGQVISQLEQVSGASQELSIDADDESAVFLRKKVSAAAGKVSIKTLDEITKPLEMLIKSSNGLSLENAELPSIDKTEITQVVSTAFKNYISSKKEFKEKLTMEQGPPTKKQRV